MSGMAVARALLAVVGALLPAHAFAQQPTGEEAGALACFGCGSFLFVIIALLVIQIAFLVWIARDAKSRGMDSAVLWMLFVFFVPLVGLLVYIFSRPQGSTVRCGHCGNNRLQASAKCPHCGNA